MARWVRRVGSGVDTMIALPELILQVARQPELADNGLW